MPGRVKSQVQQYSGCQHHHTPSCSSKYAINVILTSLIYFCPFQHTRIYWYQVRCVSFAPQIGTFTWRFYETVPYLIDPALVCRRYNNQCLRTYGLRKTSPLRTTLRTSAHDRTIVLRLSLCKEGSIEFDPRLVGTSSYTSS